MTATYLTFFYKCLVLIAIHFIPFDPLVDGTSLVPEAAVENDLTRTTEDSDPDEIASLSVH